MIAKGNLHSHGQKLAAYLVTGKHNERAELVELRGFAAETIREGFIDVQIQAEATRCERPFFHAHVRLPEGEGLDREQWRYVADRIEKQLGFEGQGRAIAFHHQPNGDTHMHVAWSRIDLEEMRSIDPGLYKNQLKQICRQLERELGLTIVRNERDPEQKTLAPGRNEFEQARRLGTDLKVIREDIRECWDRSDSGRSFAAALEEKGYILARGDQRDFVVVDPAGGDHALGKRITGVSAAETRARMVDVDRRQLPSVDRAKEIQAERAPAVELQKIALQPEREIAERSAPQPENREQAPAVPEIAAPAPDPAGVRDIDDVAARLGGGIGKIIGKVFDFLADMISPTAPPTPEQQKLDVQAAEEQDIAFQRFVAEQSKTAFVIDESDRHREQDREQQERDERDRREREGPQR